MTGFNIVLFDGFETLDAFGPAEVIGDIPEAYTLGYFSLNGGIVESSQGVKVHTLPFSAIDPSGVLLIPGGMGTRKLVDDPEFIGRLRSLAEKASYVLTVCTGSALLAKTGCLNGHRATSNKMAFEWAVAQGADVNWVRRARWVRDGRFYTSSGVSAGMDMALGFVSDSLGVQTARDIAHAIEYVWNADANNDPFAGGTTV